MVAAIRRSSVPCAPCRGLGARLLAVLALAAALGSPLGGCRGTLNPTTSGAATVIPETATLGLALQSPSALVFIADHEGYFTQAGLVLQVRDYPSGKRALEGLLAGEADLVTSADVPCVVSSFERLDLRLLATICAADDEPRIVARKDRGIRQPGDLRSKRVATQKASAVHFFLHNFLGKYGLTERDVKLSFMKAEELAPALVAGTIDAFSMREPYVSEARRGLGDRAVVFAGPGLYRRTDSMVTTSGFLAARPQVAERLIAGLLQAEEMVAANPRRAAEVVAARLGLTPSEAAAVMHGLDLRVRLDQSLLQSLEDIARWAMHEKMTRQTTMPNYLPMLYLTGLEAQRPEAVTIIR